MTIVTKEQRRRWAEARRIADKIGTVDDRRSVLIQRILTCSDRLDRETRSWEREAIKSEMLEWQRQKDELEHAARGGKR